MNLAAVARGALAAASLATLAALLVGGRVAEAVFAAAGVLFPVALIVLGVTRRGRLARPLAWTLGALLVILAASFLALFLLRGRVMEAPWVAGLPLATAILLGGIWLLPLALVGLAYALTFDRHGLTPDDLEELRRLTPANPGESAPPTPPSPEEPAPPPPTSPEEPALPPPTSPEEPGAAGRLEGRGPEADTPPSPRTPDPDP